MSIHDYIKKQIGVDLIKEDPPLGQPFLDVLKIVNDRAKWDKMISKIEAIKQELCKLQDGKSFTASMTIKEVNLAIYGLDLDDRFFTKDQEGDQIRVTCHYSEKSKSEDKKLGWLIVGILGAILAFSISQTAFLDMEKNDAKSELVE